MSLIEGIAKKIGGQGPGAGVTGLTYNENGPANVFPGKLPSSPNRCVAVIPTGGYEGDAKLPYDRPTFQIMVRGDEDPRWAMNTAEAVHSLLQAFRNTVLNDDDDIYLVSVLGIQTGPAHVGDDDNGRVQYSMNYEAEIRNPTIERPG
jgi:hypothetical protein